MRLRFRFPSDEPRRPPGLSVMPQIFISFVRTCIICSSIYPPFQEVFFLFLFQKHGLAAKMRWLREERDDEKLGI